MDFPELISNVRNWSYYVKGIIKNFDRIKGKKGVYESWENWKRIKNKTRRENCFGWWRGRGVRCGTVKLFINVRTGCVEINKASIKGHKLSTLTERILAYRNELLNEREGRGTKLRSQKLEDHETDDR